MITEAALREAIAECQGERYPSASTCIKLAAYYTCLREVAGESANYSYTPAATFSSDSEFGQELQGKDMVAVLNLMDELMTTIEALHPRLYDGVMRRLREI